jgi:hypothetical protein
MSPADQTCGNCRNSRPADDERLAELGRLNCLHDYIWVTLALRSACRFAPSRFEPKVEQCNGS